jgi:hypothetical protein
MKSIGPDPHGAMCTGTGHSKEDTRRDDDVANRRITLAIGGLLMADIWMENRIIAIDLLGQEFLDAVNTGDPIKVNEDGTVEIG